LALQVESSKKVTNVRKSQKRRKAIQNEGRLLSAAECTRLLGGKVNV
jgi:predicted Ser/Thr protein kinase